MAIIFIIVNIIININNQFSDFTYSYTYKIGGKDYNVNPCNVLINSLTVKDDYNLSFNKNQIQHFTPGSYMLLDITNYKIEQYSKYRNFPCFNKNYIYYSF